ncbi:MAG: histidine kinase dimerization/phosphoacceptor domain -containing protein [Deltaproteobacteria bacterium]|nr:histidine kinase dimerization/phosphoacceptor domain -containing protein [Deltaproteobacteria bacterium]
METKGLSNRVVIGAIAGLAGIAILLYTAYLSHREFEETLVSQTQEQLLTVAKTTANRLEEFADHLSRELKIIAKEPVVEEAIKNKTRQTESHGVCLVELFYEVNKGDIDALNILDANGAMLHRHPFIENRPEMDLTDKAGVAHVIREHKPHISEWFYNNLGRPAISISEPVFYRDKFIGMVRWVISLGILSKNFIQPIKVGKEGYAWLLDERGTILSHPDAKQLGKHIITARKSKFPEHDWSALEHIVEKARRGKKDVGAYIHATYGKRLIAYAPVHIGNQLWSIGVSMDYSEITSPLYRHAARQITIAGLVMLLFVAGGFTFYKIEKKNIAELRRRNEELRQKVIERKRAEEALRESEEKLSGIVDSVTDQMIMVDEHFNIVWVNDVARALFGPDLVGKKCYIAYHGRERICDKCIVKECFEDGQVHEFETEIIGINGIPRVFRGTASVAARYEDGRPKMVVELLRDITERKRAEEQIRASLREKEVLLKEIHHRVKNNLQVISSLLRLQSQYAQDKRDVEIFKESQNRIKSMALIHEKLYQSKDLASINFHEYVSLLVNGLSRSYGVNADKIALKTDIEDIMLEVDVAIPCGLIINELVSNSLKYAFPENKEGEIKITLRTLDESAMELTVSDDGIGMPADINLRSSESLGLKLVTILTNQIDGELEMDRSEGTKIQIRFKEIRYKKRG